MENIYLIGFMGMGKTAVSNALAKMLSWEVTDTDERIVDLEGRPIPEIFETEGEAYFRTREREVISSLSKEAHLIVSCGGGAATFPENVKSMKEGGRVVLLTASPETVLSRVKEDENRPLLKNKCARCCYTCSLILHRAH